MVGFIQPILILSENPLFVSLKTFNCTFNTICLSFFTENYRKSSLIVIHIISHTEKRTFSVIAYLITLM